MSVPPPQLSAEHLSEARFAPDATGTAAYVLPYPHFSVVMSRSRKLPRLSAVNIDGASLVDSARPNDPWKYDERLPRFWQLGDAFYTHTTKLDRGHLVRRVDPGWGTQAAAAEIETFHWTNCTPQHERLNRKGRPWAEIEDYLLQKVDAANKRISVFAGPVLALSDPRIAGEQVPTHYWKVVVWRAGAGLKSAAYLLDQTALISDVVTRDVGYGDYALFHVTVARLGELTGLKFGVIQNADIRARERGGPPGDRRVNLVEDLI